MATAAATLMACDALLGPLKDEKVDDGGDDAVRTAPEASMMEAGRPDARMDATLRPAEAGRPDAEMDATHPEGGARDAGVALLTSVIAQSADGLQTGNVPTGGASLFVAAICACCDGTVNPPTDSMNNNWAPVGPLRSLDVTAMQLFYVSNPRTSPDQVFSVPDGGRVNDSLVVLAFSGTETTADAAIVGLQWSDETDGGAFAAGNVYAGVGDIAVSFVCGGMNAPDAAITDSFTLAAYLHKALFIDIGAAYLLHPSLDAAVNPTWKLEGDQTLLGFNLIFR